MTTYRWKPGSQAALDAQIAGEELERIRIENEGRLEAHDVVEVARSSNSPLHKAFEWNDERAAYAHRIEQAKYLIRSIEVRIEEPEAPARAVRAFVSVSEQDERSYTSIEDALSSPMLREQVLRRAWGELESWRERHAELVEFAKVFSAIDEARG